MGVYILTAPPRYGKTSLMTHWANEVAYERSRSRLMQTEIQNKINSGFSSIKTIPQHCVSANYNLTICLMSLFVSQRLKSILIVEWLNIIPIGSQGGLNNTDITTLM